MMLRLTAFALVAFSPFSALADRAAGDTCAGGLAATSQEIYQRTMAEKPTPETVRDIVAAKTKELVAEGKLGMFTARSAAQDAGKCIALIK
jgi:hypothetical protein